jgi:hypothetical protein
MLHNDNYNRREYVVKILLKTVEGLTVDDAVNVMQVRNRSCICRRSTRSCSSCVDEGCICVSVVMHVV